jgi:putative transposase
VPGVVDKPELPGRWMKRTSVSMANGVISSVPLIGMATWLTRRRAEKRDREAAKRFFKQALDVVGHAPERVTTDEHDSYPRAIRETLGHEVTHRCNRSLNNRLEQDHRGIKQRYYPMRGFGSFASAARFCRAFDEQRDYFRSRRMMGETVPLAKQRHLFQERFAFLQALLIASS